jgi:predicted ATPase
MSENGDRLRCRGACACALSTHDCRLVVVTGGPGAGKTAFLEMVKRNFCEHIGVLPEAAGIVFGGGFPRHETQAGRRAAQRAIFRVQRELESLATEEHQSAVVLCDRGTLDGLAYWPDAPEAWFTQLGTSLREEMARYAAVIHLRTPKADRYDHSNPLRIESALEAAAIDERIAAVWRGHPRVHVIDPSPRFVDKVLQALELIRAEVPACCRQHRIAEVAPPPT